MNNFGVDTSFEAIILAGGLGTRLASVTGGAPKVLADVGGRPFLSYLLDDLVTSGAARVILAVGHRSEEVISQFGSSYRTLPLSYVVERQLLGTGGAILNAMSALSGIDALVLNGDTWVRVDQRAMMIAHRKWPSELTMAIAPVQDVARFGAVEFSGSQITTFLEKGKSGPGFINAGLYALSREVFGTREPGDAFSFERDILEPRLLSRQSISAFQAEAGFIDIGIPEDYARAQYLIASLQKNQAS
jgi:D-glycero-alpha-D-manno-heptose 1-phosphate guanylyltransferase